MDEAKRKRPWYRKYVVEFCIVGFGLFAVNAIFFARAFRQSSTVNPEAASQLGSFVGGYVGPIFALIGVVLLYRTLISQIEASRLQNFESKYFEMLRLHRDNVSELKLGSSSGRRLFVLFIREFRSILGIVQSVAAQFNYPLTQRDVLQVAYYCLFFGVGPNSSRMLLISLNDFSAALVKAIEEKLNNPEARAAVRRQRKFGYVPFEGHQSHLGHYYRHLYQIVRYVDQQDIDIDKYEYVKTIRAQLSTHEQALLLLNSLTPLGHNWWAKQLILPYKLVKNIPRDFFESSTELNVTQLPFPQGYFEWEEAAKVATKLP